MLKVKCDNNNGMRTYCSFCNSDTCEPISKELTSTVVKCKKCRAHFDGYSGAIEKEFYEANKDKC